MPQKVIIVDDEPYIRLLIEETLEDFEEKGVEFFSASNGKEALDLIQAEQPNLVILDAMMPRMDGFEVCRTVKQDLQMKDVFVVMLTAKGQDVDRMRGLAAGVDIYMTKPFDPDELVQITQKVLAA
jgi:DNA-binding response OmpR family regulator